MAGVFAPRGTARRAVQDGVAGYRVGGRWSWGSGAHNAQFLSAGCLVIGDDGKPEALPDGTPIVRSMVLPVGEVTLHDTWSACTCLPAAARCPPARRCSAACAT